MLPQSKLSPQSNSFKGKGIKAELQWLSSVIKIKTPMINEGSEQQELRRLPPKGCKQKSALDLRQWDKLIAAGTILPLWAGRIKKEINNIGDYIFVLEVYA